MRRTCRTVPGAALDDRPLHRLAVGEMARFRGRIAWVALAASVAGSRRDRQRPRTRVLRAGQLLRRRRKTAAAAGAGSRVRRPRATTAACVTAARRRSRCTSTACRTRDTWPGTSYDVRLSWPGSRALAHGLRQMPGAEPSMGIVAEFVAENGKASGTVADRDRQAPCRPSSARCPMGLPRRAFIRCTAGQGHGRSHELQRRIARPALPDHGARLRRVRAARALDAAARMARPDLVHGRASSPPIRSRAIRRATRSAKCTRVMMPATSGSARYVSNLDGQCSIGAGRAAALPASVTASCAVAVLTRAAAQTSEGDMTRRDSRHGFLRAHACSR